MKSVLKCLLILSLSFLFMGKVYALDEYSITINDNSSIVVKNALNDSVISDYSNILEYSNDVLTIKEGVYVNKIEVHKNITITSNNKKTYINTIAGETVELVADKLYFETYDSAATPYNNQYNVPEYTHFGANKLTIKDSNIKMNSNKGMMDNQIHTNDYDLLIENSNINTTILEIYKNNTNIVINNSNIYAAIIYAVGENQSDSLNIKINDSVLEFYEYQGNSYIQAYNDIIVNNSTIKNCKIINSKNSLLLDNVQLIKGNSVEQAFSSSTMTIKNSNLNVNYYFAGNNLYLINTSLTVIGDENNNFTFQSSQGQIKMPIISIYENIDLKSSSLEIDSTKTKALNDETLPPIAFLGTFTSDDPSFVFIDDNKNILKMSQDDTTNYGVSSLLQGGSTFNTYTKESGEKVYKIRTSSVVKYKLKIVNGTWDDGTTEDVEVNLLDGEVPNKDTIKSKSSIDGYVLSVTKTGDNEYTYEYKKLVNPKTGVYIISIGYVIFVIGFLLFKIYLKNSSLFKRF